MAELSLPRTLDEAKAYAKLLKREFADKGETISHSHALELTAHAIGYSNWNAARARLCNAPPFCPQVGDILGGTYLKQAFMGEVLSVRSLNGGHLFEVELEFDEPVDVVTFDSFSAFRHRVRATLDDQGRAIRFTSDGEPHMVITEVVSGTI